MRGKQSDQQPPAAFLLPSVKFGTAAGVFGAVSGGTIGVVRGTPPVLGAIVAGAQWFSLGTVYWFGRSNILHFTYNDAPSPWEKFYASTLAGGLSGGIVGGIVRGRSNVVPAIIMFSLFGGYGQGVSNAFSRSSDETAEKKPSLLKRIADGRWSPIQTLSDEQYANLLKERLLHIDAEIALVDDKIAELKKFGSSTADQKEQ